MEGGLLFKKPSETKVGKEFEASVYFYMNRYFSRQEIRQSQK